MINDKHSAIRSLELYDAKQQVSKVAKKCFFKKDEVTFQTYEKLLYCSSQNCKVKAKMFKLG